MKLCRPCAARRCEDRGLDCNSACECPCAVMGGPSDVAEFARSLRSVPWPAEHVRHYPQPEETQ